MNPVHLQEMETVQFHAVFESIPNPILLLKPDVPSFTILAANKAFARAVNHSRDELEGMSFFDVLHASDTPESAETTVRLCNSLTIAAEQGQPHTIPILRYDIKEGEGTDVAVRYWNLKNAPMKDSTGKVQYIIHTATDITANVVQDDLIIYPSRHIPEQEDGTYSHDLAKEASVTYLQEVIDTSQTGIFLFSPVRNEAGELVDFRFRLANRTLAAYVGQEPDKVIGTLGSTWFPSFKTNGLFDSYSETYLTGKMNRFDFHYNADGIDVWLDIMSTRINDDVLVTFSDYTPLKLLQQQMQNSLSDLKQSNNNLEQFAYVASHDLQEPLRKIKSFGDILVNRYMPLLGPEGADMIGRMQLAADRMKALIEDLLAFSRISSQQHLPVPVNLNEVVQGVLTDLEPAIREKRAELHLEPMHSVMGDALQLQQAFQNLISNALKFSKKGQPPIIHLTTETVAGTDIKEFSLNAEQRKQQYQRIVVRDNGIGFEQQYADRIFQIFQRLHGRMEYPGTGIGLSIVQKVIEHHKGHIRAKGEPGQGATFIILLPIV
jgi:PAS domain S-box-containing protein